MADVLQAIRGEGTIALVCGSRSGPPAGVPFGWVERAIEGLSRERRLSHIIVLGTQGIAARAALWAFRDARIPYTRFPDAATLRERTAINHQAIACLVQLTESARRLVLEFPGDVESAHVVATAALHSVPVWRCAVVGASSRWEAPHA